MKNTIKPLVLVFILLSFSIEITAQSKFEFSIGLGQNYSTIVESFEDFQGSPSLETGYIYTPAIIAQLGYNINSKSKLVTRQTTQWLGGRIDSEKYRALNLRTPFQYHFEVLPNLRLIAGVSFSILYDFSTTNNSGFVPQPENRLLVGYTGGLSYTLREKFELNLSYNRDSNSFTETRYTDAQGLEIGTGKSKFQYFQLAILYKVFG